MSLEKSHSKSTLEINMKKISLQEILKAADKHRSTFIIAEIAYDSFYADSL